jgi:hypothetical protein
LAAAAAAVVVVAVLPDRVNIEVVKAEGALGQSNKRIEKVNSKNGSQAANFFAFEFQELLQKRRRRWGQATVGEG